MDMREIDADKLGIRQAVCLADQIAAIAAAKLEHAAVLGVGRLHSIKYADSREPVWPGLDKKLARIGKLVIREWLGHHGRVFATLGLGVDRCSQPGASAKCLALPDIARLHAARKPL